MSKIFNVTADCKPAKHYMVNLDTRLAAIKKMVDDGAYFTINRARQYGKTTTLRALNEYLKEEYYVVLLDFQRLGATEFESENTFALSFARIFLRALRRNKLSKSTECDDIVAEMDNIVKSKESDFRLLGLFEYLSDICGSLDKPIVLLIDEVDSATNNQVFLDFLSQLRADYIDRDIQPAFQSVILAGVHDIKNLKRKIRPEDMHKINSPWNIATDFSVDMSFSKDEIAQMLQEYDSDYQTGMDVNSIAKLIHDYTSGYPFLVSRLCKIMDEEIYGKVEFDTKCKVWTKKGFFEAVKLILSEKNMLFESLSEKLVSYPELNTVLNTLLFTGRTIPYNYFEPSTNIATMFGFVKNQKGTMVVSNRIFETWLYNLYLSESEMQKMDIYAASLLDKNQFIVNGHLNVRRIFEKFVVHFHDLYGNSKETFIEEVGRKYFLLYLRPIINGVGNYYIESQTRDLKRTDIIIDYAGEQYIIEMKIWHGNEYNSRGEKQLAEYLDAYHLKTGYMLSFNFNKRKTIGVHEIVFGDKLLIEAVV